MNPCEYKVRPVVRYVVTEYDNAGIQASSSVIGEFDSEICAEKARDALDERFRLREYVAVCQKFVIDTKATYFQTKQEATEFCAKQQELYQEEWRVFSR